MYINCILQELTNPKSRLPHLVTAAGLDRPDKKKHGDAGPVKPDATVIIRSFLAVRWYSINPNSTHISRGLWQESHWRDVDQVPRTEYWLCAVPCQWLTHFMHLDEKRGTTNYLKHLNGSCVSSLSALTSHCVSQQGTYAAGADKKTLCTGRAKKWSFNPTQGAFS